MTDYCIRCGECCRHISGIPELEKYDSGNGVCCFLKDNLCQIYENRPDVCNAELLWKKYFQTLPWDVFYEKVKASCRDIMKLKEKEWTN